MKIFKSINIFLAYSFNPPVESIPVYPLYTKYKEQPGNYQYLNIFFPPVHNISGDSDDDKTLM